MKDEINTKKLSWNVFFGEKITQLLETINGLYFFAYIIYDF